MILGNHDYMGNPLAQIEFTSHPKNVLNLWHMPNNHYKVSQHDGLADLFATDTNGCQGHVQRSHPGTINDLMDQLSWLDTELKESAAQWKFVIGHHPMYNKGKGHGPVATCLREEQYTHFVRPKGQYCLPDEYVEVQSRGFGMENVVRQSERVIYLSGHEHVFQHHYAKGVQHVVCGNSGAEVREGNQSLHNFQFISLEYYAMDEHISLYLSS
jgi:tartrate-resistant acid phosphatase type 5